MPQAIDDQARDEPTVPPLALFLDFDGTLVDIAERPEAVSVEPSLVSVLGTIRDLLGGALALVSGRPVAFLDERLSPLRLDAAGLHGVEHRIAGRFYPCRPEDHPDLRAGIDRIRAALGSRQGIIIEDKGCSVAVHWRLAPAEAGLALDAANDLARSLGSGYRIQYGKAVAEILPAASGKGRVIEDFLTKPPFRGRKPVFIGDDLTDEHGFEAVNRLGGTSVRVGHGDTVALRRVPSPVELRRRLAEWAERGAVPADWS
jgi:trehalose 6-phosphate phosphatase